MVTHNRSLKHGKSVGYTKSPELKAWSHAKSRCFNPNDPKFPLYGGRGITMCAEWANNAAAFLEYMGPRPIGTTLDRIEVDGNYQPGNCQWATARQQSCNRRCTLYVDDGGRKVPMTEFARARGISYKALWASVRRGESVHAAASRLSGSLV